MMGCQHANAKPRGQIPVQVARDQGLVLKKTKPLRKKKFDNDLSFNSHFDVFSALSEALGELRDDVLVVVQEVREHLAVLLLVLGGHDLGEVVEDVEGADVELVDGQDGGVAAHDEGEGADAGDPVRDPDRQLLVEVLG